VSIYASIIKELVKLIRSDKFGSPASKVALVGHSLGSVYSNAVLNSDPGSVDAAILTDIAYNITDKGLSDRAQQPRLVRLQNA
jgi:alpha-beta hydrolase superfamily lysophospholipase